MDVLRLTLRQLQIFVAVAHNGSTTAASEEISLSQSATSSAVNELERLLSLRLFDRSGKRLLLNDNGRTLLPRALALLDGASSIERMSRDGSAQAQTLRIGASTTIGNYVLSKLLKQFLSERIQENTSGWKSKITIANTEAICDAVAEFDLDIGLIEGPCHQSALSVTPWLQDELVVVMGARNSDVPNIENGNNAGKVALKTLRGMMWLLREPGSGTRDTTDQLLLPHLRSYQRSIELGSSEAIKSAVAEGLGVACLSHWVVSDWLKSGHLCRLQTTLPKMTRQCYLVVHRDKQLTPALRNFITRATNLMPVLRLLPER